MVSPAEALAPDSKVPTLIASRLTKTFGTRTAVSDLSFEVARGHAFGLLGPNGAGKTTTVRLLTGLISPTSGDVTLFGERLTRDNADELRARVGVQTDTNLYETLTVRDNLLVWGELYGLNRRAIGRRTLEILEILALSDRIESVVGELSKGMRQKLSVGRAVLHEPELLFLDEPTAGLDPEASEDLIVCLVQMIHAMRTTVILCTHQLHGLEKLCTDVGIIEAGTLVTTGDVGELLRLRWPRQRYSVSVGADRDRAERVITQVVGEVDETKGSAHLDFSVDDADEISDVVAALVGAHVPVRSVVPRQPTLHDLYFATVEQRDKS
ncbi:MAG: ABC transporter ATP-binding protein [Actinobacteria bacterium]|nr:ABC transporter ATP-binding protein [Actinomycetota bacterium]